MANLSALSYPAANSVHINNFCNGERFSADHFGNLQVP